ncbi:MAG: cytochrome P450 [Bacteroidetes bacterium]|nr:cytochrome P450 [Bacteroidota bacterium]HET6245133.1 cytochrome P450 [Bacteroidia bacterium]
MKSYITKNPSFIESLKFVHNISVSVEENMAEYGDLFKLKLPFHSIYAVAGPQALHDILIKNDANFIKSKIYWAQLRAVVGDALGTYEGEEFVWMKKLQMKAYTKAQAEIHLHEVIRSNESHFAEWETHSKPLNITHAFSELNVAILLKVLFGKEHDGLCDTIAHYIADGEETISWRSAFPWRPYTAWLNGRNQRYKKSVKFFGKITDDIIAKNLDRPPLNSLIGLLLSESSFLKENSNIDKEIIRNELIIHLGAGTETAAVGMGWAFYLLHKHPGVKKKIFQEIDEVVGCNQIKPEHAFQLEYTAMVLKEALRLYPPSHGIVRDAIGEVRIGEMYAKPGDTFFISTYALHRNPKYWQSPNEFIPERFKTEPEDYTYIPFGAGKHSCIGRYLAQPMMILAVAQFLQKFDFEMNVTEPVLPLSMATLKPNQPLLINVTERRPDSKTKTQMT